MRNIALFVVAVSICCFPATVLAGETITGNIPQGNRINAGGDAGQSASTIADNADLIKGSVEIRNTLGSPFAMSFESDQDEQPTPQNQTVGRSLLTKSKSLANFVFDLRGFDWSKEGSNAILDENIKASVEAREYLLQKERNDRELAATQLILQLAATTDSDPQKTQQCLQELKGIVGPDQAARAYDTIKGLKANRLLLDRERMVWNLEKNAENLTTILQTAAAKDAVIATTTSRLRTYNHRSKLIQVAVADCN